MASSAYGRKLNPHRRLRDPLGAKGVHQSVVVTNNPSKIDQNQQLLVRFPNLSADDVTAPGTMGLAFTVSLTLTDANRTVVGWAIVKKTTIKISGNEVLSIDDSDVYGCYWDLWRTAQEISNSQYQGIDLSDDWNMNRIRIRAGNKEETETEDKAVADAYGNRFHIPLYFELLETHMPFYQSALGYRLEYELTFNDYYHFVVATDDAAASYAVENVCLEFDIITQPDLARLILNQYAGHLAILYDRVLRHRKITANKSDTLWNINLNVLAWSMKGILMLFEDPVAAYQRDTEKFYNPQLTKIEVTIDGILNQLYSQGMRAYQLWEEVWKHFTAGTKRAPQSQRISSWPTYPWGVSDHETLPLAGPPHYWWLPAPWQWGLGWECLRGCQDPDQEKGPGRRHFEHLPLCPHGCSVEHRRWPLCHNALLSYARCRPAPIQRLSVDRQAVGRQSLPWTFSRAPTGESSATSSSCAPQSCITSLIRTVHGSGRIPRSMSSTPTKGCMTAFVLCIRSSRASQPCTSLKTAVQARLWPKRRTCCPSWLLVGDMQSSPSGFWLKNTTASSRTSRSRPTG